jgi:hypothetical protein
MTTMEDFGDFMEFVIDKANDLQEELAAMPDKRRFKMIMDRIRKAEVVFAIWQDFSLSGGVDFLMLKGYPLALEDISVDGVWARAEAVTCR